MKTPLLRLQDIINLEYLFQRDKEIPTAALHKRDRKFATSLSPKKLASPAALHAWLSFRLEQEFDSREQRSPGAICRDFFHLFITGVLMTGAISGILAGLAFFSYTGTTPVNVFQFLLLFIAPQLFLIALLFFAAMVRFAPAISIPTFYTLCLQQIYRLLAARLRKNFQENTPAAQRNACLHALSSIRAHGSRYHGLFYWPIFCLFQGVGLAFNLTLCGISLIKIATCDLAFGWQSTVQLSDAAIHQLAKALALPWMWIPGGEQLLPTLAQIHGSKIVLKDGIYHLATTDLTSWWPFLIMCLLVYGIFARLLLLTFGWLMGRRIKTATILDTPQCKALLRRMQTPLVATQAPQEEVARPAPPAQTSVTEESRQPKTMPPNSLPQRVFAAIDIYQQFPDPQTLQDQLAAFGFQPQEITPFLANYNEDQLLLKQLAPLAQDTESEDIVLLLEGWMVPLVSLLSYIKEIRRNTGPQTSITIALVGKPGETVFTAVKKRDFAIWQQQIASLADPYIHTIALVGIQAEEAANDS